MLDIQIEGSLPEVNPEPFASVSEQIAEVMFRSVQQNFIEGGRPIQWTPLRPLGESSHLYKSGNLFESIQMNWDDKSAMVSVDTARVPYAAINNYGGVIKHPGSKKLQVFEFDGMTIFTHGTIPHDINIPARPFMIFQDEDMEKILEIYSGAIFIQDGEKIQ